VLVFFNLKLETEVTLARPTRDAYHHCVKTSFPLLLATCFCLALPGCTPPPVDPAKIVVPPEYPLRADWIVVSTPKSVPSGWFPPGRPPLVALDLPHDTLTGDEAALLADVKANAILNTRQLKHMETDPRPLIAKGLQAIYGTPAQPRVQLTMASLEEAIAAKEKELKDLPAAKKDERDLAQTELKDLEARRPARKLVEEGIESLKLDPETLKTGGNLFRNYCQQCHGLTGDGYGPGALALKPLPRDYRSGKFKFLASPPEKSGVKPRRADLYRTIANGLDGSAMPAFRALPAADIDALVSYVIHLSLRGETEYQVFAMAADKRKAADLFVDGIPAEMEVQLEKLLPMWKRSNETPVPVEPDPYVTDDDKLRAAAKGHAVFTDASQGGCIACHIGYGKTAPYSYDDWGGITKPRQLTLGTFRVGRSPEDLFARIYCGIPGVGMPSLSDAMLKKSPEEEAGTGNRKWELVHFVRTISDPILRRKLREQYGIVVD
jgi:mono/diheme cytochrome c family protein